MHSPNRFWILQINSILIFKCTIYQFVIELIAINSLIVLLRCLLTSLFFLFFLFMGVTGTFWMQTRSRREEIGIMKSFGATRNTVMRIFLIEGFVLTTLAVAVACFLYLQYALKEGLYNPLPNSGNNLNILGGARFWFEHFQQHFTVISLLTWVLLLVVVCIGIYLPARGICRIPPTDALREE